MAAAGVLLEPQQGARPFKVTAELSGNVLKNVSLSSDVWDLTKELRSQDQGQVLQALGEFVLEKVVESKPWLDHFGELYLRVESGLLPCFGPTASSCPGSISSAGSGGATGRSSSSSVPITLCFVAQLVRRRASPRTRSRAWGERSNPAPCEDYSEKASSQPTSTGARTRVSRRWPRDTHAATHLVRVPSKPRLMHPCRA